MAKETPPAAPLAATTTVAPSWLSSEMTTLAAAHKAGRLPHGLLLHEAPGAGGDWLAKWLASLVFCQNLAQAPCGKCQGCHRVATAQHPDLVVLQPIEESRQIRIEQIRELSAELALTAHQGSYKVAVITPADTLNRFAANALLKTLEEPPAKTLLMLVVTQPSRLPATILSRCQRIRIRAPARQEAVAWLEASRGPADWNAVLDTLGEAPMLAADVDPKAVVEVGQEVRRTSCPTSTTALGSTSTASIGASPSVSSTAFQSAGPRLASSQTTASWRAGARMRIRWHRLRMVAGNREGWVTTSIRSVLAGGSSRVLRSALAANRLSVSAGVMTATL